MKKDFYVPLYLQVVTYFKERISLGEMGAGEKLPSRREVAQMFQINLNTVQKAFTILEREGLIITERNAPSNITMDQVVLQKVRKSMIRKATTQYIKFMKKIDVSEQEIISYVKKQLGESE